MEEEMAEHLIGISLAMIVRDGAATLRDCLVSAAPFVDEMVVVDTGSTDGALEIAKAMGANVIEILEQAVHDTPEEPYLWYNLGKTLTHPLINHPDEAHLALERSRALLAGNLTLAARAAYRSSLYEFIVNNLIRLGWQEVALAMADEATILNGPSFEFSYLRGILLLGLGRPEEAINAFKDAIDQPSATAIWNGGDG